MASAPLFWTTPVVGSVQISTANTARDGTGTLGTVLTGATGGTIINKIIVRATVTTTAGTVRLFIDDGSTVILFDELIIEARTVAASTPAYDTFRLYSGDDVLWLPSGSYILKASTEKAEAINVIAFGATP